MRRSFPKQEELTSFLANFPDTEALVTSSVALISLKIPQFIMGSTECLLAEVDGSSDHSFDGCQVRCGTPHG